MVDPHTRALPQPSPADPGAAVRRRLARRLAELAGEEGFSGRVVSVVIDQLAVLNSQLGWANADRALDTAARRLEALLGPEAAAGHLGGGLILVVAASSDEPPRTLAERLELDLRGVVAGPGPGSPVPLSCRAGEVPIPRSGGSGLEEAIEMVERCEQWVRMGGIGPRRPGRAGAQIGPADPAVAAVVEAVDSGSIEMRFQPVVALGTGAVVGAEALARWPAAPAGFESPEHFLRLAAVAGRQREATDHILDQVCCVAARPAVRRSGIWLSANLSAAEAVGADMPGRVRSALERHDVRPERIILELSEQIIPDLPTQRSILDLHGAGLRVAIDDFGSGWSSLAQLTALPIELVKLDRSIIVSARDGLALLEASVTLASALGLQVLAEGIETVEDLALVQASGVDLGQGFLLGAPAPVDDLERALLRQTG